VALYLSGAEGRIVWDELKKLKLLLSKAYRVHNFAAFCTLFAAIFHALQGK